jgi:hypothetical protein
VVEHTGIPSQRGVKLEKKDNQNKQEEEEYAAGRIVERESHERPLFCSSLFLSLLILSYLILDCIFFYICVFGLLQLGISRQLVVVACVLYSLCLFALVVVVV